MACRLLVVILLQALACSAWAQGMDLMPVQAPEADPPAQELGGQTDPMSELLHWAIENSDPELLKNLTEKYKEQNLTTKDIYGQDVIDAFFKTEGDVLSEQIAIIQDYRNHSLPESEVQAALEELEEVLHQVDHAGNLHKMGGMQPMLDLALGTDREEATRALALWALGVAVQNNAPVQRDLHSLGGLQRMASHLPRCGGTPGQVQDASAAFCGKLLFAISGLSKNSNVLQAEADHLGVPDWMIAVGLKHDSAAVVKKALGYLDILLAQNPEAPFLDRATPAELVDPLLELVRGRDGPDVDTSEKAISLFSRLCELRPGEFAAHAKELEAAAAVARQSCLTSSGGDSEACFGLETAALEVCQPLTPQGNAQTEL